MTKASPKTPTKRRRFSPKDPGAASRLRLAEQVRRMIEEIRRLNETVQLILSEPGMNHWITVVGMEASTPEPSSTSGSEPATHASNE